MYTTVLLQCCLSSYIVIVYMYVGVIMVDESRNRKQELGDMHF